MAMAAGGEFSQVCFYVTSAKKAAEAYSKAFGFEIGADYGVYISMKTGKGKNMLGLAEHSWANDSFGAGSMTPATVDGKLQPVELHVSTPDSDAYVAKAKKHGFTVVIEPFNTPWGHSRFAYMRDLDGNLVNVAGPAKPE